MQCILSLEHKIRHMLFDPSFSGGWACTVYRDFTMSLAKRTHSVLPWYDKDSLITLVSNETSRSLAGQQICREPRATTTHTHISKPKTAAGCHAPFSTH
jgi:hypothetical protein